MVTQTTEGTRLASSIVNPWPRMFFPIPALTAGSCLGCSGHLAFNIICLHVTCKLSKPVLWQPTGLKLYKLLNLWFVRCKITNRSVFPSRNISIELSSLINTIHYKASVPYTVIWNINCTRLVRQIKISPTMKAWFFLCYYNISNQNTFEF